MDPADDQRQLAELRRLLLPCWIALHQNWTEPVPARPSRYMCRYTAEAINLLDPTRHVVLGQVDGHTHAWNERDDGRFCDLTGDQFDRPAVQTAPTRPASYLTHQWTESPRDRYRARAHTWLIDIGYAPAAPRHPAPRTLIGGTIPPCPPLHRHRQDLRAPD